VTAPDQGPADDFYGWQARGYERGMFVEDDAAPADASPVPPGLPAVLPAPAGPNDPAGPDTPPSQGGPDDPAGPAATGGQDR